MSDDTDPNLSTSQAIQILADVLHTALGCSSSAWERPFLSYLGSEDMAKSIDGLSGSIGGVASAIEQAFGRDHGDIGFVGEIANGLISIGSALGRLATVAERHLDQREPT